MMEVLRKGWSVLSSCTHCFPAKEPLGRLVGCVWGWGVAQSCGGRSPPFPGPLTAGSEPCAKNGGRQGVYFRDVWGPSHSFLSLYQTQLPVLSKTPTVLSLSREAAGLRQAVPGRWREPLECHWWPGPSHGHSPLQTAEEIHSQVVLCRRQESVALAQTMTLGPAHEVQGPC